MAESTRSSLSSDLIKIPIIIGVTGHRDLNSDQIPAIKKTVHAQLENLAKKVAHSPLMMLNSLAEGADQLCAEVALDLGIPLITALPLPKEEYAKDFSGRALAVFHEQCNRAQEWFVVPSIESPENPSRHYAYRQAGIFMAKHCHVLLALWDGSRPEPDGCGTSEVVDFMMNSSYTEKDSGCLNVNDGAAVLHNFILRTDAVSEKQEVLVSLLENVPGTLDTVLTKTDEFNQRVRKENNEKSRPLIEESGLQQAGRWSQRIHALYQQADMQSVFSQKHYLKSIRWLSIFAVSLVVSFLFYDELESNLFLFVYGLILLITGLVFTNIRKKRWHEKYLETRVLAESLRVQFYLCVSGIKHSVHKDFTWSQKKEVVWVEKAIHALTLCPDIAPILDNAAIKSDWIDDQYQYHARKASEIKKIRTKNELVSKSMLITSIITFATILGFEWFLPDFMNIPMFSPKINSMLQVHPGQQVILRGVFKILLGLFAAVTLFLSNYYGKLSLDHKIRDHEKMASLYQTAQIKWNLAQTNQENLLIELAREEIIENGGWLSYHRENAPTFDI